MNDDQLKHLEAAGQFTREIARIFGQDQTDVRFLGSSPAGVGVEWIDGRAPRWMLEVVTRVDVLDFADLVKLVELTGTIGCSIAAQPTEHGLEYTIYVSPRSASGGVLGKNIARKNEA